MPVLSGAALLTAQHTGRTMEKLVEKNSRLVGANARPVLQFLSGNVGPGGNGRGLSMTVANVGTGSARVIWFELSRNGRVRRNANDLIDHVPKPAEQDGGPTRPVGGTDFPADEERQFLGRRCPGRAISRAKWDALDRDRRADRITASVCFCSSLGECWTSKSRSDTPTPVKTCEGRARSNFSG